MTYSAIISTPICHLGIHTTENELKRIEFLLPTTKLQSPKTDFATSICNQLTAYFKNPAFTFNVPLPLTGTPFQQKVWQALRNIPRGQTLSYGELAEKLKTSPRAIGNACRSNPFAIITPCHRVTAKNHVGGFTGKTQGKFIEIKQWLLQHESL